MIHQELTSNLIGCAIEDHKSQLLAYLRLGKFKSGLLINFNVPILKNGIKRLINDR